MMAKGPARHAVRSAAIYGRIADLEGKAFGMQRRLEDYRKLAADRGWPVGGADHGDNDDGMFMSRRGRCVAAECLEIPA
jgi:site-specific DNA recombinase